MPKKHQNNNEQCEVAKISYFGLAIAKILAHRKKMLEGFFEIKAEGVHENFCTEYRHPLSMHP